MLIGHHAHQPSCTSAIIPMAIMPVGHHAHRPSCLLAIIPIGHHAHRPSCPSAIVPICHHAHHAYQPSGLLSWLLSLLAFFMASKHWRLTEWLFWNLLKHLRMISISFVMFGTCLFFYLYFLKITDFFCLYFVISTFVYNVKFSYWSMTVQLYKTKIKK